MTGRPDFPRNPWAEAVRDEYRSLTMTRWDSAVADAMAQGMRKAEAEHDASLTVCKTCDEPAHRTVADCDTCGGRGHVIGGDAYRPCPGCRLAVNRAA